jgi:hypothetical protein
MIDSRSSWREGLVDDPDRALLAGAILSALVLWLALSLVPDLDLRWLVSPLTVPVWLLSRS